MNKEKIQALEKQLAQLNPENRQSKARVDMLNELAWEIGFNDMARATKLANEANKLAETLSYTQGLAQSILNLAFSDYYYAKYEEALARSSRAYKLFEKVNDKDGRGNTLIAFGFVYWGLGDFDKALNHMVEGLRNFKETENEERQAWALTSIGGIYENLNNRTAEATSLLNLGKLFDQMNEPERAIENLKKALAIAESYHARPKIYQAYQALSESYERLGSHKQALQYYKKYQEVRAEVFNEETNTKIKNIELKYEVEKAEKESEIHRLKNIELAEAMENLKQSHAQLIQSEKMAALGSLIAGVAHEVNTPIGVIASGIDISERAIQKVFLEIDQAGTMQDIKNNKLLQRALRILKNNNETTAEASNRIARIVNSLKNFARLDEAEYQYADVHEGIESTLAILTSKLSENTQVIKNFGELPKIKCFPHELNQVFMTLLVNAAEAIENKGTISIDTLANGKYVFVRIRDTGRGIPADKINNIFDIGFSHKDARMRMRIGLPMCYTVIKKHRGQIMVASAVGEGTTFSITLPVE